MKYVRAGTELIAEERQRQIDKEGWTEDHDAGHQENEILHAAICYAINADEPDDTGPHMMWPWEDKWWKPTKGDTVRDLVKSGALIAAEIDRRIKWRIK